MKADPARSQPPLRAYAVFGCEDEGAIVFARIAITARVHGANEFNDGELGGVSCCRAPWADRYAESGVVPASDMIDAGWRLECQGCGCTLDSDHIEATGRTTAGVIGTQYSAVYCDRDCRDADRRRMAETARRQARLVARFQAVVRRRFPDARLDGEDLRPHVYIVHSDGRWLAQQVIVHFSLPCLTIAAATLRWDRRRLDGRPGRSRPAYYVCAGDREAFKAYVAAHPRRARKAA